MSSRGVLFVGCAIGDMRPYPDERWPAVIGRCSFEGSREGLEVVGVIDLQNTPAVSGKARRYVVGDRNFCAALDCDAIVVPDPHQLAEPKMSGERGCLGAHSLHEIAVRAQDPGPMVDHGGCRGIEPGREVSLGQCHADRRGNTLSERARRHLGSGHDLDFGMAGSLGCPLPEILDFVEIEVVTHQVEHAVEQCRGMAAGQHETVAVRPLRVLRIVLEKLRIEHVGNRRETHGCARMPRVRLFDRVDGEGADGGDGELINIVESLGHGASSRTLRTPPAAYHCRLAVESHHEMGLEEGRDQRLRSS